MKLTEPSRSSHNPEIYICIHHLLVQCGVKLILFFCQQKRRRRAGCLHETCDWMNEHNRNWSTVSMVAACVMLCALELCKFKAVELTTQRTQHNTKRAWLLCFFCSCLFYPIVTSNLCKSDFRYYLFTFTFTAQQQRHACCIWYISYTYRQMCQSIYWLLILSGCHVVGTFFQRPATITYEILLQQLRISHWGCYGVMVVSVACPHPKRLN